VAGAEDRRERRGSFGVFVPAPLSDDPDVRSSALSANCVERLDVTNWWRRCLHLSPAFHRQMKFTARVLS